MSELVAELLQGLDGLHPSVLYLLAGLFTALETSVGIGGGLGLWPHLSGPAVAQPRPRKHASRGGSHADR
jgi:hypothetical protein